MDEDYWINLVRTYISCVFVENTGVIVYDFSGSK